MRSKQGCSLPHVEEMDTGNFEELLEPPLDDRHLCLIHDETAGSAGIRIKSEQSLAAMRQTPLRPRARPVLDPLDNGQTLLRKGNSPRLKYSAYSDTYIVD